MKSFEDKNKLVKIIAVFLGFMPTAWLIWLFASSGLGANPIQKIIHINGLWALRLIVLALSLRAFAKLSKKTWVNIIHRTAGYFAAYYALLHFSSYIVLDQFFDLRAITEDVIEHKRLIVGFAAFLLLFFVAVTSINRVMKRIGFARWRKWHKATYIIAICGAIHYIWLVKKDIRTPLIYGAIVATVIIYKTASSLYSSRAASGGIQD